MIEKTCKNCKYIAFHELCLEMVCIHPIKVHKELFAQDLPLDGVCKHWEAKNDVR